MKAFNRYPNVILVSPSKIKQLTSVNGNVEESDMFTAALNAQNTDLQPVIGSRLLWKLQELVATGQLSLEENMHYKVLLDQYVQPFLCVMSALKLVPTVQFKMRNKGLVTTSDDKVTNSSWYEMKSFMELLRTESTTYANLLKEFLTKNWSLFPELTSTENSLVGSNRDEQVPLTWVLD